MRTTGVCLKYQVEPYWGRTDLARKTIDGVSWTQPILSPTEGVEDLVETAC